MSEPVQLSILSDCPPKQKQFQTNPYLDKTRVRNLKNEVVEREEIVHRRQAKVHCYIPQSYNHDWGCRCGSCATGTQMLGTCGGCDCHQEAEQWVSMKALDQKDCKAGTIPWDVWTAHNSPIFSSVWGCFSYYETMCLLDQYSCYKLCGCGGERSVLLAATHFLELHTRISNNMAAAMAREATHGRALAALHPATVEPDINRHMGQNHWVLSASGLEYLTIKKAAKALASLAIGIR